MPRPSVEAERRQQILSAACEVISTMGVPDLRLVDVAKEAGVSSGTVHYYFDTKRDVINAAFAFNLEDSFGRRQELLHSTKGSLSMLKDLVESYLPNDDASRRAWKVWVALWAEATRDTELQHLNERLYGQWRDLVSGVIRMCSGGPLGAPPRRMPHHASPIPTTRTTPAPTHSATGARCGAAAGASPDARLPELAEAESASYSSTISRSSIARSFIDWSRCSGFLARQRRIRRLSSAGTLGFSSSTGVGVSWMIRCIVSKPLSAAKGRCRVAAS